MSMTQPVFADRLIARVRALDTPLCVGLDPYAEQIPALFGTGLAGVERFCAAVLEETLPLAAAVKPQSALFEAFGWEGARLLAALVGEARAAGAPVILDAKRGDIGATAAGYAAAALGSAPGLDADAVTVAPYMGRDSLEPFLQRAEAAGKGVAVLVRTSNPGAADVQALPVEGAPVWEHVGAMIAPLGPRLAGACGWSGLMAVVGATAPREAVRARALLPHTLFLTPGYGAQGASAADAVAGFPRRPDGVREGGVVNASRSVLYPPAAQAAGGLAAWRAAVREAVAHAAADLRHACRA
jgi:orotidine-5'-phosphate decarboxylase